MTVETKNNQIILKEVYEGICLETNEGKRLYICMRDFGFEVRLQDGDWHRINYESDFKKAYHSPEM